MAKILIVDDSGLSRRILRRILSSAGHEVVEAESGLVALERYFLERPDLVLLDLIMADMNGLEVLDRLREMDRQARVVVATADIQSSSRALAMAGGAMGYIAKPFDESEVLQAVDQALGKEGP